MGFDDAVHMCMLWWLVFSMLILFWGTSLVQNVLAWSCASSPQTLFNTMQPTFSQMCADDSTMLPRRFMELWTLKEAYVKALGRGISAPPGLRGFSVHIDRGDNQEGRSGLTATSGIISNGHHHPADHAADHHALACSVLPILGTPTDAIHSPLNINIVACSQGAMQPLLGSTVPPTHMPCLRVEQHVEDVAPACKVHMVLMEPDAHHVGALCCVDAADSPLRHVRVLHVAPG